jgi:hypothetical protein
VIYCQKNCLIFAIEKWCANGAAAKERLYKIKINLPPQNSEQTEKFRPFAHSPVRPFARSPFHPFAFYIF